MKYLFSFFFYMLSATATLYAGGANPRYHGNGIWTSDKQQTDVTLPLILAALFGSIIVFIVIYNFYKKYDRKIISIYKIITNGIPLLGIIIFVIWFLITYITKVAS